MNFNSQQIELLENNKPFVVLQNVRDRYPNIATQSSVLSKIKRQYMEDKKHRVPEYHIELQKALDTGKNNEDFIDFDNHNPHIQNKIQKKIAQGKTVYGQYTDTIIAKIPIVNKECVQHLKLPKNDSSVLRQIQRKALNNKHHNVKNIDADDLMKKVIPLLLSDNIYQVIVAVLLATGRRQNELVKGNLTESDNDPYMVTFSGQSKTGLDIQRPPYNIPVLAHANFVIIAWNKAKNYFQLVDSPDQFKKRIRNVARWLKRNPQYDIQKLHQLRSIYARISYILFPTGRLSEMAYISEILGQQDIDIASHYNSINVHNVKDFINPLHSS